VHTPEFAFEHVTSNVQAAVKRLGVTWPVVQDNRYKTWDNYANQYWPAEYLVDKQGHVRHTHFGEGEYDQTDALIRKLLGVTGVQARHLADATPTGLLTPESYLGYARLSNYVGTNPVPNVTASYHFAKTIPGDTLSYNGRWRVGAEEVVAGKNARLRLRFQAKNVYIVLGGRGTVQALIDGKPAGTIKVDAQRLYTVRSSNRFTNALLELRFSPGVQAYSFTFG
jgi:Thioredoxin like C-terminal domain